jgi:predicted dienelactone hydrolase
MSTLWALLALMACGGEKAGGVDADADADTDVDADADADADTDADADADTPLWHPPDAMGPYTPGTAELSLTGRTGVELKVQVWYPSGEDSDMLHRYDGLLAWDAIDTPAPDCSQTRPVLAFSHGNQGVRWQSPFIVERLASHGFVVVAPDHTGNTTFDYDATRVPELIFRRPLDVMDAVDWLFDQAPDHLPGLEGCLDETQGYAVSGHSFGGYTATAVAGADFDYEASLAYCDVVGGWLCDEVEEWVAEHPEYATASLSDDRVWAAIPLAPAGFEVLGPGAPMADVPFLVLGGEYDNLTPMLTQVQPIFDALGSEDKMLGTLLEAGHMVFSMACELTPMTECDPPYLDYEIGQPTIATAITAWLQMQLGNPDAEAFMPYTSGLWVWEGE